MKRKIKFESPTVLQAVDLSLEGGILLKGSIVDQIEVISAGQEVHDLASGTTTGIGRTSHEKTQLHPPYGLRGDSRRGPAVRLFQE